MDGSRFDQLTKTLAHGTSRRRMLQGLAGALTGALAASRLAATEAACPAGSVPAAGGRCLCKNSGRPPVNGSCTSGAGPSGCGAGQMLCGTTCVDASSDPNNCGTCSHVCAPTNNATSVLCRAGACWVAACAPGFADCNATGFDGCETQLGTNANCGRCGDACSGFNICGGGGTPGVCGCTPRTCESLGATCGSYQAGCGGTLNCTACPSGQTCTAGLCKTNNGGGCSSGSECASGVCSLGICCDRTCDGPCHSCQTGTCQDRTGTPCGGSGVCGGTCNAGTCELPGAETACSPATCSAANEATTYECDGTGACVLRTTPCGLYLCRGGACLATCGSNDDCVGAAYCDAGVCCEDRTNGETCDSDAQCLSDVCAGGFCCDQSCDGACVSCASGTCAPVPVNTPCGAGEGVCQGLCTAAGECAFPDITTTCRAASCVDDVATLRGGCDGNGFCESESNQWCSPYRCDVAGATCLESCANDDACEDESFCDLDSTCQWKKSNGDSCSTAHECLHGFCFQGICSSGACLPATAVCTGASQCCEGDGAICAEASDPFTDRHCCFRMGLPCDEDFGSDSCCQSSDGLYVSCGGSDVETCGGVGAYCDYVSYSGETSTQCLSGVCCVDESGFSSVCCAAGQVCSELFDYRCRTPDGGACSAHDECAGGLCCNGVCITANEQHCGACDDICNPDQQCIGRRCLGDIGAACQSADDCLDGHCYDGVCCDECGVACGKPQPDNTPCGQDSVCCGQECRYVLGDPSNCGSCGVTCPQGDTCQSGSCSCQQSSQCVVDSGGGHLEAHTCHTYSGALAYCATRTEGGLVCIRGGEVCGPACTSSSQCGANQVCSNSTCCGRRCHTIFS